MKIDDYSVDIMCNTLNAIAGMVFLPKEPIPSARIRQDILDAQKMISVLYEENQKLKDKVSTPGVQFYESLDEKIFAEEGGDPWVYRTVEGLNAIRQTLDEKQSEQIWRAQELIWELYKENQKLKGEK